MRRASLPTVAAFQLGLWVALVAANSAQSYALPGRLHEGTGGESHVWL